MARWSRMVLAATGRTSSSTGGLVFPVVGFCAVLMVAGLMCASRRRSKAINSRKVLNRDSDMDDVSQNSPNSSNNSGAETSPAKSQSSGNGSSKKLLSFFPSWKFEQVDELNLAAYEKAYKQQEEANWADNSSPIWQRAIILGEKCEPPAFSGIILYDEFGNRIPQFPPKSPRTAGLSLPRTFGVL